MTLQAPAKNGFVAQRQRFFDAAIAATGLYDFGADDYSEGLDLFLDCLDRETNLSPAGQTMTTGLIELYLCSRLHSQAGWHRRPEALQTPIRAPLIITGIVRSGTTALHKLLSMDPQFQGLEHWLTRAPQPRPACADWHQNAAYMEAAGALEQMIESAPEVKEDHMMSAEGVEESIMLLPQSFKNNLFPSQWNIPTYDAWYRRQDETASYRRFAKNLQLIGADEPGRRWLLKNPTDLLAMDAVLNVFPDAMIVQTHRDPLQAIPSVANLIFAARRIFEGTQSDPAAVGRREMDFWALALTRAEAARPRTEQPVFDLEFNDFVHGQMGAVNAIYQYFGLILTPDVETTMQGWLARNPRRSNTLQRFKPEDFGVTAAALTERYRVYREARKYS